MFGVQVVWIRWALPRLSIRVGLQISVETTWKDVTVSPARDNLTVVPATAGLADLSGHSWALLVEVGLTVNEIFEEGESSFVFLLIPRQFIRRHRIV